ncbi:isochorismatase family protein [Streptomyces cinereospinus]|uniref:Isochorismatase family protein n=1 Tax=Streptomyces cinereospinus TaxID=285561 RepID=A0ABV5N8R6_9ACTN
MAVRPRAASCLNLKNAVRTFPYTDPIAQVVSNAAALAREFRGRKMPVVLTKADSRGAKRGRADAATSLQQMRDKLPANWAEVMEELEPADDDLLLVKQHWGGVHRYRPRGVPDGTRDHPSGGDRSGDRLRRRIDRPAGE